MSQFLNYITKKQAGGDISSLPGVLSLSKIQKDIQLQKQKSSKQGPSISQWNPKPGEMERLQRQNEERARANNAPLNRLAANKHVGKFMENIVEPMMAIEGAMALGRLPLLLGRGVSTGPSSFITRGHINYFDEPGFKARNPKFSHSNYVNTVKGDYVPEATGDLAPYIGREEWVPTTPAEKVWASFFKGTPPPMPSKMKGGLIIDPRGQWAHPGKITRIPGSSITMKGVDYPVLAKANNGMTVMMYPEQEYEFPGADYVDEYPMMSKGGQHGGLDRWFAEKWVDVKTGKACGRQEGEKRRSYPACRPSRRVNDDTPKTASELSPAERERFKRAKTSSKRINYQHRRKQDGGETTETDMANKPNNPALWSRAKSLAKQKFDVYPSAYANGWAAKWYKSKGGTWRKAEYGMEVMEQGGTNNPGFKALPEYVQAKILSNMGYGGMTYPFMQDGGDPDGAMALGQIDAAIDKLTKLRQFIQPESDLEPWVSSKLTMLDHYSDAVSDYMMYNPEATEEGFEGDNLDEMAQGGGIPERYKNMGFNKVGVKKKSNRPGKKWMVLAKKGDQYKVVHGGYKGMQDYTQHGSEQRRKNFWNRMGGKNSSKATDPFSPLYWHKRFGTWEDGGEIEMMKGGGTFSGNMYYQEGGEPKMEDYPDFGSYRAAYEQWLSSGGANSAQSEPVEQPVLNPDDYKVFFNLTPTAAQAKATASYSGPSIVDMLNSMGKASDYQSRKKMAQELGITNYRGTAAQNTQMMRMLMEGVAQNPTPAPKKAAAKPKAAATQTAAKEQPAAAGDSFFEMAKRAYLAAHPGMTSEQYDRQVAFTGNPNTISQAKTPLKGTPRQGEYSDAFILSQIDRDPRSQKNINKRKRQEFAEDLAMGTLAPWLAEGALMALTTRYLPHGLKALPQVVEKARDASRALPAPMKRLPGPSPRGFVTSQGVRSPGYPMYMNGGAYSWKKQFGGPMEGEELEVTPEELEMLRAQGYEFEMI